MADMRLLVCCCCGFYLDGTTSETDIGCPEERNNMAKWHTNMNRKNKLDTITGSPQLYHGCKILLWSVSIWVLDCNFFFKRKNRTEEETKLYISHNNNNLIYISRSLILNRLIVCIVSNVYRCVHCSSFPQYI